MPLRQMGGAIVCGLFAALLTPVVEGDTSIQFACAATLLAVAVVGAVALDWRRTGDKLSIFTLVGIFYLLAFVVGSVYVWFNPSFGLPVAAHLPFSHAAQMRAEWLCLFSWIAFAVGYRGRLLSFLHVPPLRLRSRSSSAQQTAMFVLYCAGWVARFAGISRGLYFHPIATSAVPGGSTLTQAISVLSLLPSVSVAYLGVRAYDRPNLRWYYRAALAIELGFGIPSGNRVDSVTVLVLALAVYYYTRRRLPLKAMAVGTVFVLFFVFPVLALYRTSHSDTGYRVTDLSGGLQTYTSGGLGNAMMFGIASTLTRFSDIELPAALEERGRQAYPVSEGETIGWLFTNYIPHAIDPKKRSLITFVDDLAYALRLAPGHNSSFAPTQVGEMYLNFGTIGAMIAMLVLGTVYREINDWLLFRREEPTVLALYAAFAYAVITTQESLFATSFGGLVRNLIVVAIIIRGVTWLLERSANQRPSRAALGPSLLPTPPGRS